MPAPKLDSGVRQPVRARMWPWHLLLLAIVLGTWYLLTKTEVLSPFFFGEPLLVAQRVVDWFASGKIFPHLGVTLLETLLAFVMGTLLGLSVGLWLALSPFASRLLDPYITAVNSARDPGPHLRGLVRTGHLVQGRPGRDAGILHRVLQRL
jgi:NitT/TauT family transport system permease protein